MACFLVKTERGKQSVFEIKVERMVFGRGRDSHLVLPDISVSRNHGLVVRTGPEGGYRYEVQDLGSSNGLVVNGNQAKAHQLTNGDEIVVGKFILTFQGDSAPAEASGDKYALTGRTGFLERVTAVDGENVNTTARLDSDSMQEAMRVMRIKDDARLRREGSDAKSVRIGEKGVMFGKGGVELAGMGIGGAAAVVWKGNCHYVRKLGGLMLTIKLNGKTVKTAALNSGDKIQIGKATFFYEV